MDLVSRQDGANSVQALPGGSPANVALGLGRLGREVYLHTCLGDDDYGQMITSHLNCSQVRLTPESLRSGPTSTATASIGPDGSATYDFQISWDPAPSPLPAKLLVAHAGSIAAVLDPGWEQVYQTLIQARTKATITYDPNARPSLMGDPKQAYARIKRFIALADVVKVSDEDIAWLSGGAPLPAVANEWMELGPALVIVTKGGAGVSAWTNTGLTISRPATADSIVDTVGAGDSFMGGVIDSLWGLDLLGANRRRDLHCLGAGDLGEILAHAGAISAITVSRAGANPPWRREL